MPNFRTSIKLFPALGLSVVVLLSACSDQTATSAAAAKSAEASAENTVATAKPVEAFVESAGTSLAMADLPADAPEIGTDIKTMVTPAEAESAEDESGISSIMWEDLVPDDYKPEAIMAKYVEQIEALEEGSPEELKLFSKLQAEFNNAPSNATLAGKTVKIPGFVSPLDDNNGMVGEFLLVPYFGSCIHSPPPPINQTVLVKPQEGKSIAMKDIYQPVWVVGEMKVEPVTTDLAQAGYQIENARLEPYTEER